MKYVLLITVEDDEIADYLMERQPTEIDYLRLNVDKMDEYNFFIDNERWRIKGNGLNVSNEQICGIYHMNSSGSLIMEGLAEVYNGPCLNRPSIMKRAQNKIIQMQLASALGFHMPRNLITNDTAVAGEFCIDRTTIVKITDTMESMQSAKCKIEDLEMSDYKTFHNVLQQVPLYFRRGFDVEYEVKAVIFNNECFCVKAKEVMRCPWMNERTKTSCVQMELPRSVREKCLQMMERLDLDFVMFTFAVCEDVYYFLDLNVRGSWATMDSRFQWNLTEKIPRYFVAED